MPPLYAKFPYAGGCIYGYSAYVPMCVCMLSSVRLFVTLWTVACQAPLSMGFSRQEYWNGLSMSSSRGWNPRLLCLPHWQVGSLPRTPPGKSYVPILHLKLLRLYNMLFYTLYFFQQRLCDWAEAFSSNLIIERKHFYITEQLLNHVAVRALGWEGGSLAKQKNRAIWELGV